MSTAPYEPYTRREEYQIVGAATLPRTYYHPLTSGPPFAASVGGGSLATNAGSPSTATTDPCFLNEDGTPEPYCKLDPGDILTRSNGGYNLEVFSAAWVRIDSFPGADANLWLALGGDGVGIDSTGKIFCINGGVKQGTEAGTRTIGEWFHLAKVNDAGGGGTGTFCWINGVRVLSLGGAGGVKNNTTIGSAGADFALCHWQYGQGSTAMTDAQVKAAWARGARKYLTRAMIL